MRFRCLRALPETRCVKITECVDLPVLLPDGMNFIAGLMIFFDWFIAGGDHPATPQSTSGITSGNSSLLKSGEWFTRLFTSALS